MFIIDCFRKVLSSHVRRIITGAIIEENGFLVFDLKLGNSGVIQYEIDLDFEMVSISTIQNEISVKLNNQQGNKIGDIIVFENNSRTLTFVFESKCNGPLKYYFRGEIIGFFDKSHVAIYNLSDYLITDPVFYDLKFKKTFVRKFEDRKNFYNSTNITLLYNNNSNALIVPLFIDKWFRFLYPTEVSYVSIKGFTLYNYDISKLRLEDIIYFCLISINTDTNTELFIENIFCTRLDISLLISTKYNNTVLGVGREVFYQLGKMLGIDKEIKNIRYEDEPKNDHKVKLIAKTLKNIDLKNFRDHTIIKIFPPYGFLRYTVERPIYNLSVVIETKNKNEIFMVFLGDGIEQPFPSETPLRKVKKYFEIRLFVSKVTKAIVKNFKIKYMF